MDTTETYIKMCEKAEEIQALSPQIMIGSVKHYYKGVYQYEIDSEGVVRFWESTNFIWLPRQDQLQEMIGESPYTNIKNAMWSILDDLHKYAFTPNIFNKFIPTTMEQLWLAFVMKEKYNKVWNGEKWLKQ